MGAILTKFINACLGVNNNEVNNHIQPGNPTDTQIHSDDEDIFGTDIPVEMDDENISLVVISDDEVEEEEEYEDEHIFTYYNEKKALLIGINYNEDNFKGDDLSGCVNDMNNLNRFLHDKCFFFDDDITALCNSEASRENIENELTRLVVFSHEKPGSEIWLSYSGHGSNVNSLKEDDLKSEVICPSDYASQGIITDKWLQDNFVKGLEKTTKLFVLMDCCNSGSNLNLPYRFKYGDIFTNDSSYTKEELDNLCNIVKISGCEDDQTSADYFERQDNEFQGALTNGFLHFSEQVKSQHNNITFFYNNILSYLTYRGFMQRPVLTFSKPTLLEYKLFKL